MFQKPKTSCKRCNYWHFKTDSVHFRKWWSKIFCEAPKLLLCALLNIDYHYKARQVKGKLHSAAMVVKRCWLSNADPPFKIFWPFYLPLNVFNAANCTYLSTKYLQTIFSRILFLVREGFRCNWGGKWNQRPYFQTHLFLLYPQGHKVRAISTAENPCTNFSGNIWATSALKHSFEDKFVSYFNLIGKELRFCIRRRTSPPPN